jgi:hypothetical protein
MISPRLEIVKCLPYSNQSQFGFSGLQKLVSLRSGGLSLLVYWATLLLTLVTNRLDKWDT